MPTLRERANEKLAERKKLIDANRAVMDAAEGRAWTGEETQEVTKRRADIERLKVEADALVVQARDEDGAGEADRITPDASAEGRTTRIEREFRTGSAGYAVGKRAYEVDADESRVAKMHERFAAGLIPEQDRTPAERRALQMDVDDSGGYTVAPQRFVADLIQAVDNRVFLRGLAKVDQLVGSHTIGRPSLDADPADPTWTSELLIGSEDTSMDFGKRELMPHPLAQFIKVSRKLLRHSNVGVEAVVRERLGYKMAVVQEAAFMTGTGASQPLGLFTASDDGIGTARDVSTGNTGTSITFDGLKEAKWTLKSQYHARSSWIFHRDAGKQIDKLKDGNGQYIWQESVQVGAPDRLLGLPVNFSEYAPSTFTTGLYVGILGDYSNYWIVESLAMEVIRLNELYAATNQVGFITRSELDAMPVLAEAFVRVKLG